MAYSLLSNSNLQHHQNPHTPRPYSTTLSLSSSIPKSAACLRRHLVSLRFHFTASFRNIIPILLIFVLLLILLLTDILFDHDTLQAFPNPPHFLFAHTDSFETQHLHDHYSIPYRMLSPMSLSQHQHLFDMIRAQPPPSLQHHDVSRYVLFAHVTDCHLQSCLRAMATAISYAQMTERIAVLFIDSISAIPISRTLSYNPPRLNNHTLLIPTTHDGITTLLQAPIDDWAEFNLISAVAPTVLARMQPPSNDSQSPLPKDHLPLPKIANTEKVATLDNVAAIDKHVFVTLSEVTWSRYAPRSVQESVMSRFKAASSVSNRLIANASLLGRHVQTRSVFNTDRQLVSMFKIPRMLLRGMTPLSRKLLLLKLLAKQRHGVKQPRALFVHTQYGLGNRLRALGSAMAFARRTDRVLVLIWVPDQHLNCKYTELFVPSDEFIISHAFGAAEEWPFPHNTHEDENMKRVRWYNFMRVNGSKIHSSESPVPNEPGYHLYISTCYVIQSEVTPFIIRATSSFWYVLRSLPPTMSVLRLVERYDSYPMSDMIGIHIRGRSIKRDISGVVAADYTVESSRTTDYWRNLTQVDAFIGEMRRQHSDQLFYVAADSTEVFDKLQQEFPSRVFYTPRKCDSRDKECLPFALADILLLAQCKSLRGSYWSSFSELSTRIGGARFLLAGIDFGRP